MSKDDLHAAAQADTPPEVTVPASWRSLIVWAVGRFGVGIVLAIPAAYACVTVYGDMRNDRAELMAAYQQAIAVMEATKEQIRANTTAIEALRQDNRYHPPGNSTSTSSR